MRSCIIIENGKIKEIEGNVENNIANPVKIRKEKYWSRFWKEIQDGIRTSPRN